MTTDDTIRPMPFSMPPNHELPRQDIVDHLRLMSLNFATDSRRVGAEGSDIRACYALRSLVCDLAARKLAEESTRYPTWAFSMMVDSLVGLPCQNATPYHPDHVCGGSDCITEYCATCFARKWQETYPL